MKSIKFPSALDDYCALWWGLDCWPWRQEGWWHRSTRPVGP